MKKALKILLGIAAFFIIVSLFIGDSEDKKDSTQPKEEPAVVENIEEGTLSNPYDGEKAEIYDLVVDVINEGDYLNTTVNEITLNDNMGNDDGGYILLVRGTFDIKNSRDTGNELLRMYSNDLMGALKENGVDNIVESAIFWEDSHNNRTVKYSYEYKDDQFEIYDVMGE